MPETTPRVLLFGNSRAGKTSILNVVFQKMAPHETLFVQPTQSLDIKFVANNAFVQFQIWDFPGYFDLEHDTLMYGDEQLTNEMVLGQEQTAIIFVIDAQDEPYQEALQYLVHTFHTACRYNPNINFEVFIHKVDGDLFLTDEQKYECLQEIQESIADLGEGKLDDVTVSHHLTSNHDHSIYEAVSKVVQKLMPQLSALEKLLNTLISNCDMEKSFLFDVVSKIYIASDSNPVDIHIYELCSDMIDVVIDVSCIYGVRRRRTRKDENGDDVEEEVVVSDESTWAYDSDSTSMIRLSNGMVLYLREVNSFLALVCLLRADNLTKKGIIDYNIDCFKRALSSVFEKRPQPEAEQAPSDL